MDPIVSRWYELLEEARSEAEIFRAFRDDDIRLGDETSAMRWNRLWRGKIHMARQYESMIRLYEGRVG